MAHGRSLLPKPVVTSRETVHTGLNRHARRKLEKLIRQAQKRAGKRRG